MDKKLQRINGAKVSKYITAIITLRVGKTFPEACRVTKTFRSISMLDLNTQ